MNILKLFPSGAAIVGRITYEQYETLLYISSFVAGGLVIVLVWLIITKKVNLPLLTEIGLFFIIISLISVSDNMISTYGGDPVAVAVRWLFACIGVIFICISAAVNYVSVKRRIGRRGRRSSDFMPLYNEYNMPPVLNPHGVQPDDEWRG